MSFNRRNQLFYRSEFLFFSVFKQQMTETIPIDPSCILIGIPVGEVADFAEY